MCLVETQAHDVVGKHVSVGIVMGTREWKGRGHLQQQVPGPHHLYFTHISVMTLSQSHTFRTVQSLNGTNIISPFDCPYHGILLLFHQWPVNVYD